MVQKTVLAKKSLPFYLQKKTKIYTKNYQSISSKGIFRTKRPNFMCMNVKKFEKKFKIKMPSVKSQIEYEAKKYKLKK